MNILFLLHFYEIFKFNFSHIPLSPCYMQKQTYDLLPFIAYFKKCICPECLGKTLYIHL